jgi:anti-sigma factor RsiW
MMTGFYKNEDCPPSDELNDYQNGDSSKERSAEIRRHMATCEFCDAEVEFYSNYPVAAEESQDDIAEIPAPLYELAEALLKNRHNDNKALNALLEENKKLVS